MSLHEGWQMIYQLLLDSLIKLGYDPCVKVCYSYILVYLIHVVCVFIYSRYLSFVVFNDTLYCTSYDILEWYV